MLSDVAPWGWVMGSSPFNSVTILTWVFNRLLVATLNCDIGNTELWYCYTTKTNTLNTHGVFLSAFVYWCNMAAFQKSPDTLRYSACARSYHLGTSDSIAWWQPHQYIRMGYIAWGHLSDSTVDCFKCIWEVHFNDYFCKEPAGPNTLLWVSDISKITSK